MFENCITFAMCSTSLDVKNCTVRFDQDPAYPGGSMVGPVNELFELPILQRSTRYYHQAEITLNNTVNLTSKGIFTTGDCEFLKNNPRILCSVTLSPPIKTRILLLPHPLHPSLSTPPLPPSPPPSPLYLPPPPSPLHPSFPPPQLSIHSIH